MVTADPVLERVEELEAKNERLREALRAVIVEVNTGDGDDPGLDRIFDIVFKVLHSNTTEDAADLAIALERLADPNTETNTQAEVEAEVYGRSPDERVFAIIRAINDVKRRILEIVMSETGNETPELERKSDSSSVDLDPDKH